MTTETIFTALAGSALTLILGGLVWILRDRFGVFRRVLEWGVLSSFGSAPKADIEINGTGVQFTSTSVLLKVPNGNEPLIDVVIFVSNEITDWGAPSNFPDAKVENVNGKGRLTIPSVESGQHLIWFVNAAEFSRGISVEHVKCSNAKSKQRWDIEQAFKSKVCETIGALLAGALLALIIRLLNTGGLSS